MRLCVLRNLALARACWTANRYLQSNPSFPSWNMASHCTSVMLVILAKYIANIRASKGVLIPFRLSVALTIWVRRLGLWSILTTGSTLSTNTCQRSSIRSAAGWNPVRPDARELKLWINPCSPGHGEVSLGAGTVSLSSPENSSRRFRMPETCPKIHQQSKCIQSSFYPTSLDNATQKLFSIYLVSPHWPTFLAHALQLPSRCPLRHVMLLPQYGSQSHWQTLHWGLGLDALVFQDASSKLN